MAPKKGNNPNQGSKQQPKNIPQNPAGRKYDLQNRGNGPKDRKAGTQVSKKQKKITSPNSPGNSATCIPFIVPKKLPPELTINFSDGTEVTEFWLDELNVIQKSFPDFVQREYFVNKFAFLKVLLKKTSGLLRSCNVIFLPTGCCKTVMSHALQHFYSSAVKDRTATRKLYKEILSEEEIKEHEGKYYVLRLSFRNIPYQPEKPFAKTMETFLKRELRKKERDMFKDETFKKELDVLDFMDESLLWLYKNHGKIILIIDEIDCPAIRYSLGNAKPEQVEEMTHTFRSFLDCLADCTADRDASIGRINYIEQIILFGIHEPLRVFDRRTWNISTIFNKKTCVPHFLFNKAEVECLLEAHGLADKFSQVEQYYGNYNGEYFLPASVVAFVKTNGTFGMYKSFRPSYDILNLNVRSVECLLFEFIDNKPHLKTIKTNNKGFVQSIVIWDPFIHYIFAGLLCILLSKKDSIEKKEGDSSKMKEDKDSVDPGSYELCAGNLENLNIIAFFLERAAGAFN